MEKEIGLVYFIIYEKIKKRCDLEGTISRRDLHILLGRSLHIEKRLHDLILKEMESFNFISEVTKKFVTLNMVGKFSQHKRKKISILRKQRLIN